MSQDIAPKNEVRALWVVRTSITSPEAIQNIIRRAKEYGFNTLIVQVRGRADAYYKSDIEPRAEPLEGQPEDFDPLQVMLSEAKQANLSVHAWMNVHYVWHGDALPKSPYHIVNARPDWLIRDKANQVPFKGVPGVEGAFTCPSNPEVKDHIHKVYLDVAQRYEVDGVHFDFVRYPNRNFCYCDGCLARFKAFVDAQGNGRGLPKEPKREVLLSCPDQFADLWDDWRRQNISDLVRRIYTDVKALKPHLTVSAAVFASFENAYKIRFQNWRGWLREGILDVACPMAYATQTETVVQHIKDAVQNSSGKPIWAGIGAWRIPPESTIEKIFEVRKLGVAGIILFSYGGITKEGTSEDYLKEVKEKAFAL